MEAIIKTLIYIYSMPGNSLYHTTVCRDVRRDPAHTNDGRAPELDVYRLHAIVHNLTAAIPHAYLDR